MISGRSVAAAKKIMGADEVSGPRSHGSVAEDFVSCCGFGIGVYANGLTWWS
jgi:hypothetical protein